jgi:hypothetical protein
MLGVALVLGSVLAGATIVSSARNTQPVLTAAHDLSAGTVLGPDDLRIRQVRLPDGTLYQGRVNDATGRVLTHAVSQGELISRAALSVPRRQTTISVPLDVGSAPQLRKGQRIELWMSSTGCSSLVLLREVTVQKVRPGTGLLGRSGSGQDVVISLAPALAERVVAALAVPDVQLRAGILLGKESKGNSGLPELAPCTRASA